MYDSMYEGRSGVSGESELVGSITLSYRIMVVQGQREKKEKKGTQKVFLFYLLFVEGRKVGRTIWTRLFHVYR